MTEPASFFRWFNAQQPYPYQQRVLEDASPRVVWVAGRQVGKSRTLAVKALHYAATGPGRTVLMLAPTQEKAGIVFWTARQLVHHHATLRNMVLQESAATLRFKNGSSIVARPTGQTGGSQTAQGAARGYAADLVLVDEAAFVPDVAFESVIPTLAATGGQLVLVSTPFGTKGLFYRAFNEPSWSKHRVASTEAPHITKEFLETERLSRTEVSWRQEYLGEFVSVANQLFDEQTVLGWLAPADAAVPEGQTVLGVDLAREGLDESVYVVARVTPELDVHVTHIEATSKQPLTDAEGRIKALVERFGCESAWVDESGLGAGVVDSLKESGVNVKGVTFSVQAKHELYTNLVWLSDHKKLFIHQALSPKYLRQFTELEPHYTSTNLLNPTHPEGGHDDVVAATALACFPASPRGGGLTSLYTEPDPSRKPSALGWRPPF